MVNFACGMILPSRITDSACITPSDCTCYPSRPPKMCHGAYLTMPMKPGSLYVILLCFIMILILCLCCDLLIPLCQTAQSPCIPLIFCDCKVWPHQYSGTWDHHFMKPSDFEDLSASKILQFVQGVGLLYE
jgi:hypothetical protein